MWTCTEWLLIAQILSGQRQKTTKIWKFISGTYARKSLLKVSKKVFQLNSVTFDEQHKPFRGNWSEVAAGMHWFMTAFHMPLILGEHRGKVSVLVFRIKVDFGFIESWENSFAKHIFFPNNYYDHTCQYYLYVKAW